MDSTTEHRFGDAGFNTCRGDRPNDPRDRYRRPRILRSPKSSPRIASSSKAALAAQIARPAGAGVPGRRRHGKPKPAARSATLIGNSNPLARNAHKILKCKEVFRGLRRGGILLQNRTAPNGECGCNTSKSCNCDWLRGLVPQSGRPGGYLRLTLEKPNLD